MFGSRGFAESFTKEPRRRFSGSVNAVMKNFYLETFGCQMNVVDSEQIVDLVQQLGYVRVGSPESADLIILNTCSIRARAERKVYGHLGRFKPLKQRRPGLLLAVCGCVAQQEGERMLQKVPYLDVVCGTHNVHRLGDMVRQAEERRVRCAEVAFLEADQRRRLFPERRPNAEVTRFVTVIQGCDNFCSYCIVPHVRGREVSRPAAEVLHEVRTLVAQGVREVTLIGQNVNSYGRKEGDVISFAALLKQVNAVEGLERIRFMTSHPKDLSDELVDCFGELDKLCKHIHLPVQAGGDAVLKAMRRGYTREQYLGRIARLRRVCPDIRVTSDVIVGFPGETESDFEQTMDLLRQVRFAEIYSFIFSFISFAIFVILSIFSLFDNEVSIKCFTKALPTITPSTPLAFSLQVFSSTPKPMYKGVSEYFFTVSIM